MSAEGLHARFGRTRDDHQRRAVIDIGSNTVRLVIYGGPPRAPEVLWNEKVSARLGRDLAKSGEIPTKAMEEALAAVARYALLVRELGIANVETVATAAPRDAANGGAFIEQVASLGLAVRVLSGEEEACASAYGAIGAFPGAAGLVADLGGGSLELVGVSRGECSRGASLPLGTLRLPALRAAGRFRGQVAAMLRDAGPTWSNSRAGPIYMVGGTWRAFATYTMRRADHPLTDPHGFVLGAGEADRLAGELIRSKPAELAQMRGISAMRADKLPDAAALLRVLLAELTPGPLVFSSWGLREGLHFQRLDRREQARDPLLAGVEAFAAGRGVSLADAAHLAQWSAPIAEAQGEGAATLRLAAACLAVALHRVEPNLRAAHALEWALDKRWIGIDFSGRAMLGAALRASLGLTAGHDRLLPLADEGALREATAWGLAFRLAQRFAAGSGRALSAARLAAARDAKLELHVARSHAVLASPSVAKELAGLAKWMGRSPGIVLGS